MHHLKTWTVTDVCRCVWLVCWCARATGQQLRLNVTSLLLCINLRSRAVWLDGARGLICILALLHLLLLLLLLHHASPPVSSLTPRVSPHPPPRPLRSGAAAAPPLKRGGKERGSIVVRSGEYWRFCRRAQRLPPPSRSRETVSRSRGGGWKGKDVHVLRYIS